jgi:hypothetical protein
MSHNKKLGLRSQGTNLARMLGDCPKGVVCKVAAAGGVFPYCDGDSLDRPDDTRDVGMSMYRDVSEEVLLRPEWSDEFDEVDTAFEAAAANAAEVVIVYGLSGG